MFSPQTCTILNTLVCTNEYPSEINISFLAGLEVNRFGSLFANGHETYFNEDINRCFFVVYFVGVMLAFGAGFDFLVAFNLADLVAF